MVSPHASAPFRWRSLLFWFCLTAPLFGTDQEPSQELIIQRLGMEDGLSNSYVFSILQDRRGFLWIGTESGLNLYDGQEFKYFQHDPNESGSISEDDVSYLLEDEEGVLWAGTWGGGLNRMDPKTQRFTHYRFDPQDPNSIGSDRIHFMLQGEGEALWIGTFDGGLNRMDKAAGTFTRYTVKARLAGALPDNRIWMGCHALNGRLWLATNRGLALFNPQSGLCEDFQTLDEGPFDLKTSQIRTVLKDRLGLLWVGTNQGLARLNPVTGQVSYFGEEHGLSEKVINTIFQDRRGNIWFGTQLGGLFRYLSENNSFFSYGKLAPDRFGQSDIRQIFQDRSNVFWVGVRGGGLFKFDHKPQKFKLHGYDPLDKNGLSHPIVRAIWSDPEQLWVGTAGGGLNRTQIGSDRFQHFRHDPADPKSLSHDMVHAVLRDRRERLWVGTSDGLNLLNESDLTFKRFYHSAEDPNSLVDNTVTCLAQDRKDQLWIGTQGGLSRFDGREFRNFKTQTNQIDAISGNRIFSLLEDAEGFMWVGTGSNGINRFNPNTQSFNTYQNDPNNVFSLSNNTVLSLHEFLGFLWIGTHGGGLNRFNTQTRRFKRYLKSSGLPNNVIYGILNDGQGALWLSTGDGLCRMNPVSEKFRSYDVLDGLQSNQFTAGACHEGLRNRLYFGGINGFNEFFGADVTDNPYLPPVVITALKIHNRPAFINPNPDDQIHLTHKDNVVNLEFRALDFTLPQKNQYAYKMAGVDQDWIYSGNRGFATYTNLPPGTYEFHVKASNNDGIWNEEGARLVLRVSPPFYKTWWAMGTYLFLIGTAITALVKFSKKREREKAEVRILLASKKMVAEANRAKQVFLAHMSHELRTPLTAIIGYSELVEELLESGQTEPQALLPELTNIKASAYHQLALVTKLLELSKIEAGQMVLYLEDFSVKDVLEEVLTHFEPQLTRFGNRFEKNLPDDPGTMHADQTKVREILLNLLTNANNFTENGLVTLTVERGGDRGIFFIVEDTGVGMSPDQIHSIDHTYSPSSQSRKKESMGLGLLLTKHFCQMMQGELNIESEPGKGSRVCVNLPSVVPAPPKISHEEHN